MAKQLEPRDMDWEERGRNRRAANFYRIALKQIHAASLVSADKLREMAEKSLAKGNRLYLKK